MVDNTLHTIPDGSRRGTPPDVEKTSKTGNSLERALQDRGASAGDTRFHLLMQSTY